MADPVDGLVDGWTGAEHLPRHGPVVLASRHGSFPDLVLLKHDVRPT